MHNSGATRRIHAVRRMSGTGNNPSERIIRSPLAGIRQQGSSVRVRLENIEDIDAVQTLNESACETSAEACLMAALRVQAQPVISRVAVSAPDKARLDRWFQCLTDR